MHRDDKGHSRLEHYAALKVLKDVPVDNIDKKGEADKGEGVLIFLTARGGAVYFQASGKNFFTRGFEFFSSAPETSSN